MGQRLTKYFLCFGLGLTILLFQGCMMGGHGGGGGGGGGMGLPAPVLSSIAPATVVAGGPPFLLTVNGSGFVAGGFLLWNGISLGQYTFVSSTQVTMEVGSGYITNPGSAGIVATIPSGISPSNSLNLTVNPFSSSACVLFGLYNFFFTGFDSSGPVTVAGEFGVDANGNVNGEVDFKDMTTTRAAQPITGGTCANGATANEGTISITTAAGTSNYTFVTQTTPAPGVKGRMVEVGDANGVSGSGRFVYTPGSSFFSGDYVVAMIGNDSGGGRMGLLGRFTDNDNAQFNTPGTLSGGLGDINDNGALTQQGANITGTVTVPDLFSRCTTTLAVGTENLPVAFYVNTSSAGFAIDVDSGAGTALLAGFITAQANAGLYNNGFLSAPDIFNMWGVVPGAPSSSDTSIGIASGFSSGPGTFNFQLDSVTGGAPNLNQNLVGATYSIASTGRGTMTFTPMGGTAQTDILYLDDFDDGYLLQTSGNVGFGFFQTQKSTTLNNGTFLGGTLFSPISASPNTAASITLSGGTISGAVTGTYTITGSRGTGTVDQPIFGSKDFVFYIFGNDGFVLMGSDAVANDAISFLHI